MQYDLNQLADPKRFQRLVNAILIARFGEDARLTPIQGADGGSDGETAAANPYMEFAGDLAPSHSNNPLVEPPRPGRYLFQAKYHRTGEQRLAELRAVVVGEFKAALTDDVLYRPDRKDVNYFFLVTNVTSSKDSLLKIDEIRSDSLQTQHHLHADVWWGEKIVAFLDWAPELWHAYPELFPGGVPPLLGMATSGQAEGLSRTFKLAVTQQYERDSQVKFRQIELAKRLLDLFVDLDFSFVVDGDETSSPPHSRFIPRTTRDPMVSSNGLYRPTAIPDSVLHLLLDDDRGIPRILLEGGPGQGKSTITQMAAQVYREKFLEKRESESRDPIWHCLCQLRVPIRVELRDLAHWIAQNNEGTFEQYVALKLGHDAGGVTVSVEDIHRLLNHSSVILILDGLDEIGNDALRDQVLDAALEAVTRFEEGLKADVRVVLTTRPPAVLGRWSKLQGFIRVVLAPMEAERVNDYVERWLHEQISNNEEKDRIKTSFESRRGDSHVEALARNPMQLSVLLQFIYLKGEAFPDRRAELYRDYFQIVIDRDVEKSPELREHRELVEGLHSYLGFLLHGKAEIEQGRRALNRSEIIELAGHWLEGEGYSQDLAGTYFALGEERFGLIVALSGEGQETAYGFEVQPIEEYFAAAYISNRLANGKAHEIFELLIHKDYWREVALFLAGLRRPNEKADLVARAKEADADVSIPAYQNGRAIILQLLREGVLSQPRHVQTEAMRFAMGFLEARTLRLHRAPTDLINSLSELARQYGNDETYAEIAKIAQEFSQSGDHGLVSLIHQVAGNVLPKDKYIQLVLGYSGMAAETCALVRITCPFNVPGVIEELGCNHTYWEGIPTPVLARHLWLSATRHGTVPEIAYPLETHSGLILQFASGQPVTRRYRGDVIKIRGASVPAIWKLYQNIQLIRSWPSDDHEGAIYHEELLGADKAAELSWTNGGTEPLSSDIAQCLSDLIEASDNVIAALRDRKKADIDKSLVAYLETIRNHLAVPGIVGWIAARCAAEMAQSSPIFTRDLGPGNLVDDILEVLNELYDVSDRHFPHSVHFFERFGFGMPIALRLAHGAALRPLHQVIADLVLNRVTPDEKRYCSWLEEVPLPPALTGPLVDVCRSEIETLLRFVGCHAVPNIVQYYTRRRLKVQDTRRILKICRETNDPKILQGAATVLMNATFTRLAEPALVQKILSAAPASPLVMRVFETRDSIRGRERDSQLNQLALSVAERILDKPELHPFRVVNRAAAFLAEAKPRRSSPLFEERPGLMRSARV